MSTSYGYGMNSFQSALSAVPESSSFPTPLLHPRADSAVFKKRRDDYIYAIDSASTKLKIPLSAVEPTQALDDDGLVPGLCRLFLEGRCRQSQRCFQVHANPSVVEQLREDIRRKPSCCHYHGALCNFEGFPLGLTVTVEGKERGRKNGNGHETPDDYSRSRSFSSTPCVLPSSNNEGDNGTGIVLSLHYLCPTSYLWKQYRENGSMHLTVPAQKVCREHLRGLCRFGDECSFLHGCRQSLSGIDDTTAKPPRPNIGSYHFDHSNSPSISFNNNNHASCSHDRWTKGGNSFSEQNSPLLLPGCHRAGNTCHHSLNYVESCESSLTSSVHNNLLHHGEQKEKLLQPLGRHTHYSTATHSNSFSHNPYVHSSM